MFLNRNFVNWLLKKNMKSPWKKNMIKTSSFSILIFCLWKSIISHRIKDWIFVGKELIWWIILNYFTIGEHHDFVVVNDGVNSMSDGQNCSVWKLFSYRFLDECISFNVDLNFFYISIFLFSIFCFTEEVASSNTMILDFLRIDLDKHSNCFCPLFFFCWKF